MLPITITYLNHSGFSVKIGSTLLIFDYYPGDAASAGDPGVLGSADLRRYTLVVVFVSHAHADHFDKRIYDWNDGSGRVRYVLGYDVPLGNEGHRMHAGDTYSIKGVSVEAFDSTDEGVSFLVQVSGYSIFHAGDLNLWHWREESSLHDIELAEAAFHRAVKPLEGRDIDVAFFPVDPRQGTLYDAGGTYFVMAVKPRVMIPMHWQGRADVALDFARRNRSRKVEVQALVHPGESITLEKPEREAVEQQLWSHEILSRSILQERIEQSAKQYQEMEKSSKTEENEKEAEEDIHEEPDGAL